MGSRRRAKATIWTKAAVLCPSVLDQNWYNPQGGPRLHAVRSSLVPHGHCQILYKALPFHEGGEVGLDIDRCIRPLQVKP